MNTKSSNTTPIRLWAGLFALCAILPVRAQFTFDCGSTGSYGAMNITENTTLEMPDDGIFHCTTINVAAGVTLKFTPNALNTPVYLLATGDVTISGTIDVSGGAPTTLLGGIGGPGGFAGGHAGSPAGDGHGPGAGHGGTSDNFYNPNPNLPGYASYGSNANLWVTTNGATYGSPLLIPLVGGSGGGGNPAGGGTGGGGAVMIASDTSIVIAGGILAKGGGPTRSK